jgi:hypothetical protein
MGEDFETRKKEYLDRLRSNFELFEMIKFNEKKQGDALLAKEMVLNPKNEDELIFAVFTLDFTDLAARSAIDDVKTILPKDNIYLDLLANVMNSLKTGEDVEHMVEETKKNPAKYLYDYVVGFINDIDSTVEYLAEETGYNVYDEFELAQFQLYLEKANSIINISEAGAQQGMPSTEKARIICDEFHRLCEEGRLESIIRRKNIYSSSQIGHFLP